MIPIAPIRPEEAEECRKEYEQKIIRIYEQLLQDSNIQYQENLARLREEKDKAISEAEQIKQEAEECCKEYEQKIREKEQSLHDSNIQYQENLARLREEKDQANSEAEQIRQGAEDAKDEAVYKTLARLETQMRPLNDLFLRVQGLLLSDFSAEVRAYFPPLMFR
ncbi:hypothetical protein AB1Y20_022682 [Prymnesium parvum]|uniref:Uncharacterized protein n=1 Tax=Prymnesium parvum TaxID=97485 RepID=A0AB34JJI8_PRYPA